MSFNRGSFEVQNSPIKKENILYFKFPHPFEISIFFSKKTKEAFCESLLSDKRLNGKLPFSCLRRDHLEYDEQGVWLWELPES